MVLAGPAGAKSSDPGLTDVDRKVSEETMRMWTQFAKTGDPSVPGLVSWPAWNRSNDRFLFIVEPLQVKSRFSILADIKKAL